MYRRFLLMLFRRSLFILVLICLGCAAQSAPPEQIQRIEREVRSYYSLPANVQINIGPLHPSEFPNYDALTISLERDGKKQDYDFLLAKDGKTLIRVTKLDLTKDPYAETMKKINTSGRPIRGDKDAKVVVVNFDDFQCPFCSRMHQTLFPELLKEYGDRVLFVYKDYPLEEIHPWAVHAAVNANCLAVQNNDAYWDYADYLHANQHVINAEQGHDAQIGALDRSALLQAQQHNLDNVKLLACMKAQDQSAVRASIKEGDAVGVQATPTLFVNGEEMDGALPIAEIRAVLDRALTQAGVQLLAHPGSTQPESGALAK